jgi:hypothetical protein
MHEKPRKPFQFGLASLLGVVTVVAVGIGAWPLYLPFAYALAGAAVVAVYLAAAIGIQFLVYRIGCWVMRKKP